MLNKTSRLLASCAALALTALACGGGPGAEDRADDLSSMPVERPLEAAGDESQVGAENQPGADSPVGFPPQSGTETGLPPADPTPQQPTATAPGGCPEGAELRPGDVSQYLLSRPIAASGSEGFTIPSGADLNAFQTGFAKLLGAAASAADLTAMNFAVGCHPGGIIVVADTKPGRGGGAFAINPAATRNAWIEIPHAISDQGTLEQGIALLASVNAKALIITGTHRCASSTPSSCSGTSRVCGGTALRVTDAAHFGENFFTAAHRALRTQYPSAVAVSVHGMDSPGGEKAVVSDGTSHKRPSTISQRVRDALNKRLPGGLGAFSCNDAADDGKYRPLCGSTNLQGRIDNGSADACGAAAASGSDRFVHIEQSAELRGTATGANVDPTVLGAALAEVLP